MDAQAAQPTKATRAERMLQRSRLAEEAFRIFATLFSFLPTLPADPELTLREKNSSKKKKTTRMHLANCETKFNELFDPSTSSLKRTCPEKHIHARIAKFATQVNWLRTLSVNFQSSPHLVTSPFEVYVRDTLFPCYDYTNGWEHEQVVLEAMGKIMNPLCVDKTAFDGSDYTVAEREASFNLWSSRNALVVSGTPQDVMNALEYAINNATL
jgi:hypothetical protein